MNAWQRLLLVLTAGVLVTVVLSLPTMAATSISGRSSTEIEWFDDPNNDTAMPVYQYLLFNARDIAATGWNFHGYGRLADDANNKVNVESRLYLAYLDKDDLIKNLDLRLGRQFISTTAGSSLMDGLHLEYRELGPVDVAVFGGGDVTYYEGYDTGDMVFGTKISSDRLVTNLDAGFSYLQKWENDDLSHELLGFNLDYNFPGLIKLYNETQYSWLTKQVTYFLLGANYYRNPKWSLRTEYLFSMPVFSSTSIYSVFAVNEYEEVMAEGNFYIKPGLRAFLRQTVEIYQEIDDAYVTEAGLEKFRTERFSGYLIATLRKDNDGQDLYGAKARAGWQFTPDLEAGVGVHVDVFERELGFLTDSTVQDDTTSQRLWVDATYALTETISLQGKVERIDSDNQNDYFRGRVRLNIRF